MKFEIGAKLEMSKIIEINEEKRKFKREIYNQKVELLSPKEKSPILCASFDISEGGMRIVTNVKLQKMEYTVKIAGYKINAKPVHEEARHSTMMNQTAYYYGLKFTQPISLNEKQKILKKMH